MSPPGPPKVKGVRERRTWDFWGTAERGRLAGHIPALLRGRRRSPPGVEWPPRGALRAWVSGRSQGGAEGADGPRETETATPSKTGVPDRC